MDNSNLIKVTQEALQKYIEIGDDIITNIDSAQKSASDIHKKLNSFSADKPYYGEAFDDLKSYFYDLEHIYLQQLVECIDMGNQYIEACANESIIEDETIANLLKYSSAEN